MPHLTDAIQDWVERVAQIPVDDTNETPDVCIIELGGTVGDIESAPFIEAMRQLRRRAGKDNFLQIHVSLVPVIQGEQKTKPTQAAIKDARSAGLSPDLIACRCDVPLEKATTDKIAMFCQVEPEQVIAVHNVRSTYHVPVLLENQGLITTISNILKLDAVPKSDHLVSRGQRTWTEWNKLTTSVSTSLEEVTIVLVGKYISLHDSYLSVIKSLEHSAMRCQRKLNLLWVDAEHLEDATKTTKPQAFHKAWHEVCTADGILVPGGFGMRGTEGMIKAAQWARTNKTPYLGICLGMQIAVIEFARNVVGLKGATSTELNEQAEHPIVVFMPEVDKTTMGGTMRLGLRPTEFQPGSEWSKLRALYSERKEIHERHRHRYEVNPEYIDRLTEGGLNFVGKDDKGERMEVVELKEHPWYVGVQYHPEYLSRVLSPSRPYLGFVAAAAKCLEKVTKEVAEMDEQAAALGVAHAMNGINI